MNAVEFEVHWRDSELRLRKKAFKISDEPEDLMQSTALALWRYRHTFRSGTKFIAWATRVLVNLHWQAVRKVPMRRMPVSALATAAAEEVLSDFIDPGIQSAMNRLPVKEHVALILHDYADLTIPEMAAELGISERGAKERLKHARVKMRAFLGPQFARPNPKKTMRLQ